jgi:hypothetical protein
MTDSYADAPVSVAEIRSDKSANGAEWAPRDALISVLRAIDKGEIHPDAMVICMHETGSEPGACITSFRNATPNPIIAYGLLVNTILRIGRFDVEGK